MSSDKAVPDLASLLAISSHVVHAPLPRPFAVSLMRQASHSPIWSPMVRHSSYLHRELEVSGPSILKAWFA